MAKNINETKEETYEKLAKKIQEVINLLFNRYKELKSSGANDYIIQQYFVTITTLQNLRDSL